MHALQAFGQRIRSLRLEKNLSQQQLAEQIYVSRKTVGNWESGYRLPDITMIARLARCLGVEVNDLIGELDGQGCPACVIAVCEDANALDNCIRLLRDTLPEAKVRGFLNGEEALRFAAENRVAVAILDVDQDAVLALTEQLRGCSERINLIFAARNYDHAPQALEAHASGYLLKPLSREKILRETGCLRYPVPGLA